jgi:hypothetical protein
MRNLIFRVLAGLLGLGGLLACFKAIVDLNIMALVYFFVGVLFLIFAFGGYKATDWADYYMNRAADKVSDFFGK